MPAMRRQAWALMAPGLTDEEWDAFIEALTEDWATMTKVVVLDTMMVTALVNEGPRTPCSPRAPACDSSGLCELVTAECEALKPTTRPS